MKLIDEFVNSFTFSRDKQYLRNVLMLDVCPCLLYGNLIDCHREGEKYDVKRCGQSDRIDCWRQESKRHLPTAGLEKLAGKFSRTY